MKTLLMILLGFYFTPLIILVIFYLIAFWLWTMFKVIMISKNLIDGIKDLRR